MNTHPAYALDLIRTDEAFHALREEWEQLYLSSSPRNVCLSYDWAASCAANISLSSRPFILTARADGRLVGVAPLRIEKQRSFRVLFFTGKTWAVYPAFLAAPDCPGVEAFLIDGLARHRRQWDLLKLGDLTPAYTAIHEMSLPAGLRARYSDGAGSRYLTLDEGWEALSTSGPPQIRHTRRHVRKWERMGGEVERITGRRAAEHMHELDAVETRSWKAETGHPVYKLQRVRNLLRHLLEVFGERGELELWLARLEGKPVAFQVNLVTPERVWYFHGSYDAEHRKSYPGGVLHYLAIEHACQTGKREYDFLSGTEDYKVDWTNASHPLRQMTVYPTTPRGYLAFTVLMGPGLLMNECAPVRAGIQLLRRGPASVKTPVLPVGAVPSGVEP